MRRTWRRMTITRCSSRTTLEMAGRTGAAADSLSRRARPTPSSSSPPTVAGTSDSSYYLEPKIRNTGMKKSKTERMNGGRTNKLFNSVANAGKIVWTAAVWMLIAVSAFGSFAARAASCDPAPSGLVAWWPAEGNANDAVGTNNGALVGGASFTSGEVGQAFNFNGTSQYVQIPNNANWNLAGDFTIELWVKFNVSGDSAFLAGHDDGGGPQNKWILLVSGGLLELHINSTLNNGILLGSGVFSPVGGQWNHVAVTRAGTLFTFYLNGATNSTASSSVVIPAASASLTLGSAENGGFLAGSEDEVSIYNRALSGAEIQQIYAAGSAGKCPAPPSIVGQPVGVSDAVGATANFSVSATGAQPLNYQWFLNSNNISTSSNATATNATLVLTNVQLSQSGGVYSVVVSNSAG